jgi:hypothetical protein
MFRSTARSFVARTCKSGILVTSGQKGDREFGNPRWRRFGKKPRDFAFAQQHSGILFSYRRTNPDETRDSPRVLLGRPSLEVSLTALRFLGNRMTDASSRPHFVKNEWF